MRFAPAESGSAKGAAVTLLVVVTLLLPACTGADDSVEPQPSAGGSEYLVEKEHLHNIGELSHPGQPILRNFENSAKSTAQTRLRSRQDRNSLQRST